MVGPGAPRAPWRKEELGSGAVGSAGRHGPAGAHAKDLKVLKWGAAGGDAWGYLCGDTGGVPVPSAAPGCAFTLMAQVQLS